MKQSPFQEMKNTFHTMDELDLFNQSKNRLDQISEDSKLSRMIGKYIYGWNTVYPIASCLNSIPSSLKEVHKKFLEKACPGKEKEIVHNITLFLVEYCPIHFLSLPKK